jgi:predicted nuclease of predicted toxin-antitoxin system
VTPLVVPPDVVGARALELVRRLADVINAVTRLKAAMAGAGDITAIRNFQRREAHDRAVAAWTDRYQLVESLDRDFRDLALALQARSERP